eukprot:1151693-Pelagomonas_calceolata.AAC.3
MFRERGGARASEETGAQQGGDLRTVETTQYGKEGCDRKEQCSASKARRKDMSVQEVGRGRPEYQQLK